MFWGDNGDNGKENGNPYCGEGGCLGAKWDDAATLCRHLQVPAMVASSASSRRALLRANWCLPMPNSCHKYEDMGIIPLARLAGMSTALRSH